MLIEFTATRDMAYARRLLRVYRRRSLCWSLLHIGALWAISLTSIGSRDDLASFGGAMAASLAMFLTFHLMTAPSRAARQLPAWWFASHGYLFTDEFFQWNDAARVNRMGWDVATCVQVLPFSYLLRGTGTIILLDVPRAGLTTEQENALLAIFRSKKLLPDAGVKTRWYRRVRGRPER